MFLLVLASCGGTVTTPARSLAEDTIEADSPDDPLADFMTTPVPAADGFDFPVGDANGGGSYTDLAGGGIHRGWYLATGFGDEISLGIHPGEDWNGNGGGDTDLGQPVYTIARGRVTYADQVDGPWGGVVAIAHMYYENHIKREVTSVYVHLARVDVAEGELVDRRQVIGTIGKGADDRYAAHLHLEIRSDADLPAVFWPSAAGHDRGWVDQHYLPPSAFIRDHRKLPVPQEEPVLVLVDTTDRRLQLWEQGALVEEVDIAIGQREGRKREEGDLKTPLGMYFVVDRYKGEIGGLAGAYYGGHWIKINYPNRFDARWGRDEGLVNSATAEAITLAWQERELTDQSTPLGSGIGLHGWIEEWEPGTHGTLLSWGCVVLHLRDVSRIYDRVPEGSMVILR